MNPTLTPVDDLRRYAADPSSADLRRLYDERIDHLEVAERILDQSSGRGRKADEQRALDRATTSVDLIDQALATSKRSEDAYLAKREHRAAESARLRLATGVDSFGPNKSAGVDDFGRRIADAIGEVQEGRAVAFVDAPEIRTLTEGGTGGVAVPTQFAQPVTTMTAASVVMGLPGLRTIPMTSDRMRFPRLGSATVGGIAEAGSLTAAASEIDAVDVTAQKFGAIDSLSTELLEDASFPALQAFGDNLIKHLALKVDLGLLEGTGASDVVGLRNVIGINSTSMAATPTMAKVRTMEYELLADNGSPSCFVMHPRSWNSLANIVTGITSDTTTVLEPNPQRGPKTLLGYPVAFSTQITLTEGTAGSWIGLLDTSQIVVCERRPARLEVSREAYFDTDRIAVRATWRGGLGVLNPTAVSILTDVRV